MPEMQTSSLEVNNSQDPQEWLTASDFENQAQNGKLKLLTTMLDDAIAWNDSSEFFSEKNQSTLKFLTNNLNAKIEWKRVIDTPLLDKVKEVVLIHLNKENDFFNNFWISDIKIAPVMLLWCFKITIQWNEIYRLWYNWGVTKSPKWMADMAPPS